MFQNSNLNIRQQKVIPVWACFSGTLAQGICENEDKSESGRIIYLLTYTTSIPQAHAWKNMQNLYGTSCFFRFLYDFGQGNQFKKK